MQRFALRDLNFKWAISSFFLLSLNIDGGESGQVWTCLKDLVNLIKKQESQRDQANIQTISQEWVKQWTERYYILIKQRDLSRNLIQSIKRSYYAKEKEKKQKDQMQRKTAERFKTQDYIQCQEGLKLDHMPLRGHLLAGKWCLREPRYQYGTVEKECYPELLGKICQKPVKE